MAKIFLDANIFIDVVEERSDISVEKFNSQTLFISTLSIHILTYVYKLQIPSLALSGLEHHFNIVPIDLTVALNSLQGPTVDFEDNIQLHSCSEVDCDYFLTRDEKLIDLKFFGKAKIISHNDLTLEI